MYVCICNAIREADFRRAVHQYDGDAEAVYDAMGYEPQCGQCLSAADRLLEKERGSAGPSAGFALA